MAWLDDIIGKAGEDADLGFDTKSLLSSNKKIRQKGRQLVGIKILKDFLNNRYLKQANDNWLDFENNFISQKAKALRDWNVRAEIDKRHQEYLARQRKGGYETLLPVFEDIAGEGWIKKHGENAVDLSTDNRRAYNMYKKIEGERLWKNHKLEYGNFEKGPTTLEEFTQPIKTAYETAEKRNFSPYNTTVGGRILRKISPNLEYNNPTAIEYNTKVAEMMANKELPNIKDDPNYSGSKTEFGSVDYLNLVNMKVQIKEIDPRYNNIDSSVIDQWLDTYQKANPDSNSAEALQWLEGVSNQDLITSENISNGIKFTKANSVKEYIELKPEDRRRYVIRNSGNIPLLIEGLNEQGFSVEARAVSTYDQTLAASDSEIKSAARTLDMILGDDKTNISAKELPYLYQQIAQAAKYVADPNDQSMKYAIASHAILDKYYNPKHDYIIDTALTKYDIYNAKVLLGDIDIEKEDKRTNKEDLERIKEWREDAIDLGKDTNYLEDMRFRMVSSVKQDTTMTADQQIDTVQSINKTFEVDPRTNLGFEEEEITDDNAWKLFGDEGILFDPSNPLDYFLWVPVVGIGFKVAHTGWKAGKVALKSPKFTKALEKTYERAGVYVRTLTGKGKQVGGFKDPITGKFTTKRTHDIELGKAFLIGKPATGKFSTFKRIISAPSLYGAGGIAYSVSKGLQLLTEEETPDEGSLEETYKR